MDSHRSLAGQLYFIGAFSLAGTSVVAARYVSGSIGVFTIAAVSLLFATLALLPVCARRLAAAFRAMTLHTAIEILLQAIFGMLLFRFCLFNGISRTSSLEAGVLTGATPAITALLAWMLLKEPLRLNAFFGLLATVTGVVLVQGVAGLRGGLQPEHLFGNILVLCAAASESVFNILSRTAVLNGAKRERPLDPLTQTALVTMTALLLCCIPAAFEQPVLRLSSLGLVGWSALLWLGVFVTALAYICWYSGIKRCSAFTAAAYSGFMPLTSMILSTVLLREQTDLFQWIGGACVILGMILIGAKARPKISPVTNA
jgi:drug/metabolite transporter (DMT)-like permease